MTEEDLQQYRDLSQIISCMNELKNEMWETDSLVLIYRTRRKADRIISQCIQAQKDLLRIPPPPRPPGRSPQGSRRPLPS